MSTYKKFQASQDPSEDDKIMHAELETENGLVFMASDTPDPIEYRPEINFSMSLRGDNQAELTSYFEKLSAGGTVTERCVWRPGVTSLECVWIY